MLHTDDQVRHEFRRLYCSHCGEPIDVPVLCGDRFCWLCSRIRAAKVRLRLRYIYNHLKQLPGYFPAMITLSCPNDPNLARQVRHLIRSFRNLRNKGSWSKYVAGGATIIEIKRGNGGWHAHIHALVYMKRFPWQILAKEWQKFSGGSQWWISKVSHSKALYYVTKYVAKTELLSEDRSDASEVLKHYRLFQRFGSWGELKIPKLYSDAQCKRCGKTGWVYIPDYQFGHPQRLITTHTTHAPH